MFPPKQFDDLVKKLYTALPINVQAIETDVQDKIREILQSAFEHLDLISREEFDVQTKVLARTREKVELLQEQIKTISNIIDNNQSKD